MPRSPEGESSHNRLENDPREIAIAARVAELRAAINQRDEAEQELLALLLAPGADNEALMKSWSRQQLIQGNIDIEKKKLVLARAGG